MLSDHELERYARHIVLREVGGPGQAALRRARVLVVGAGGLGAPVLLYLAAAGIGTLGVVDDDAVSLSNLQRQVVHATPDIGTAKVESAAATIRRLNPNVTVIAHNVRLAADNALTLIGDYDIVADGSDNFATRYLVSDACYFAKKPLVTARSMARSLRSAPLNVVLTANQTRHTAACFRNRRRRAPFRPAPKLACSVRWLGSSAR